LGRAVLHVDMDAFFCAVEVLDRPDLAGRPLVVGGAPEAHGVVAAASYEARRYGVRSAMPMATALRLCPACVRVEARHGRYSEVSELVSGILERFTPLVEKVSIDEAYLDVTGSARLLGDAERIARRIKRAVREELGLTCSVGVATSRLVAKVASDIEKPDGLTVVEPGGEADFLAPLAIEKLPGVGPGTAEALRAMGVRTLGELARLPEDVLAERFGSYGPDLVRRARGEDETPVGEGGEQKSVSAETTLAEFTDDPDEIERIILGLADRVARHARSDGLQGRTVTLKLRDDRFGTRTRAATLERSTDLAREVADAARTLYRRNPAGAGRRVRLLGVALSRLSPAGSGQAELIPDEARERARKLEKTVDGILDDLGEGAVRRGRLLEGRDERPSARDD
jgi:DNA polymerase-4